jgi:hypothetical protein
VCSYCTPFDFKSRIAILFWQPISISLYFNALAGTMKSASSDLEDDRHAALIEAREAKGGAKVGNPI